MEKIYAIYGDTIIAMGSKKEVDQKIKSYGHLEKSKIVLTTNPSEVLG